MNERDYWEQLVRDVRQLVGPTIFDKLDALDRKRRESGVPKKKRHALMVAVDSVRAAIASLDTPSPIVNVSYVMELAALLITFDRWKNYPLYPKWAKALGLQDEYLHTAITLAAATFLEDTGSNVVVQEPTGGRAADLLLVVAAQRRVVVEVKMPGALRVPGKPLGKDALFKVIQGAMKKARTGTKGQLSRDRPGLLAIGAFHLYDSDLSAFQQAASDYLKAKTKGKMHAHVMGIGLVPFGTEIRNGQVQALLGMPIAKNPGYSGDIPLVTG